MRAAAVEVFAARGVHGLTHRAVDQAAGLPQGSTSNLFRTRQALVTAVADDVAQARVEQGAQPGSPTSVAWLELLLLARRDEGVAAAIEPTRARMRALLDASRPPGLPLTTPELAAFLTGLEYAQAVTGIDLDPGVFLQCLCGGSQP